MLDDNTHRLSNFSKMLYGTTPNVNQIPGLVSDCVFGLWTRNPEQRPLGNGVWKWYDPLDRLDVRSPFRLIQNPNNSSAQLLLGLEAINTSKNENLPEDERRSAFMSGTKLIELAFKANQKNSAAANALCELFLRKGNHVRVRQFRIRRI